MIEYIEIGGKRHRYRVLHGRGAIAVWLDGRTYYLPRPTQSDSAHQSTDSGSNEVTALMPGKLLRLEVAIGDAVAPKQPVAIMESMKMETTLYAAKAGRISEIRCQPGESLEMGQVVVVIE
ncbi:MAG TPA: acetyl-CoA carboxylase biotin carboxyl carrier protein subunit [Terriglobia bacterium]|jgi:biotin carboxyl carrier protein